ncbi:MAG: hypothetical protein F9K40_18890 [Kofleriaceae bacterium]|nr:MAG: hypothetical protein F9K40_18890 [Kofleriaceae bacterium]MBZ0231130.1 hypothetical protein [Kofleriaceae bacterium]
MRATPRVGILVAIGAIAVVPCREAVADVVTMDETRLTLALPEGWHYADAHTTRFHPGTRADVIAARGAEVHVFLSDVGCPRPAGAAWTEAPASLFSEELDVVWQSRLRDAEQACYASRRGELVILIEVEDPTTWDRASSRRLSDALIEAATGPMATAAATEALLRSRAPGRSVPLALSLGVQVTRIADPDRYRSASALYEAVGRLAVFVSPIVVRIEGEAGRASTSALRLDVELALGPAVKRDDLVASFTIGGAIGGQTASEEDSFELPEDPIPVMLRIPLAAEVGKRLHDRAAATARVRAAWLVESDPRRAGGSPTLGSDELTVDARLWIGRARRTSLLLGVTYDEALGTRMIALTAGLGTLPF